MKLLLLMFNQGWFVYKELVCRELVCKGQVLVCRQVGLEHKEQVQQQQLELEHKLGLGHRLELGHRQALQST